jgi:hypothetical protein
MQNNSKGTWVEAGPTKRLPCFGCEFCIEMKAINERVRILCKEPCDLARKIEDIIPIHQRITSIIERYPSITPDDDTILRNNKQIVITLLGNEKKVIENKTIEYILDNYDYYKQDLLNYLNSNNINIIRNILRIIGKVDESLAEIKIVEYLKDKRWKIKQTCIRSLGNIASKWANTVLRTLLKDPDWKTREAAVIAIGKQEEEKFEPVLLELLCDENKLVRGKTVHYLGFIGSINTINQIRPLLKDKEKYVRSITKSAINRITQRTGIGYPELDLEKERTQWTADVLRYVHRYKPDFRELILALRNQSYQIRLFASIALRSFHFDDSIPHIEHALTIEPDSLIRYELRETLNKVTKNSREPYPGSDKWPGNPFGINPPGEKPVSPVGEKRVSHNALFKIVLENFSYLFEQIFDYKLLNRKPETEYLFTSEIGNWPADIVVKEEGLVSKVIEIESPLPMDVYSHDKRKQSVILELSIYASNVKPSDIAVITQKKEKEIQEICESLGVKYTSFEEIYS